MACRVLFLSTLYSCNRDANRSSLAHMSFILLMSGKGKNLGCSIRLCKVVCGEISLMCSHHLLTIPLRPQITSASIVSWQESAPSIPLNYAFWPTPNSGASFHPCHSDVRCLCELPSILQKCLLNYLRVILVP